jgi:hypothetical protein
MQSWQEQKNPRIRIKKRNQLIKITIEIFQRKQANKAILEKVHIF